MDRAQFYKEVYSIIKEIPYGNVSTYGKIAQLIGKPQCSRMVGQALSHAPEEQHLPCHRVVNSQGRLVPGWQKQKELLGKRRDHLQAQWMRQYAQTSMGHYWFTHIDNRYYAPQVQRGNNCSLSSSRIKLI